MGQLESLPLRKALEKERDKSNISVLNLQSLDIGERDAEVLSSLFKQHSPAKLQMIQLGACSLSPESLNYLAKGITATNISKSIIRIDLSTASNPPEGNPLGNNAAQSLAMLIQNCSNLHHFKIADCQLDCNGMTLLSKSLISTKSLETLDLSYNFIGDEGASELGNALSENKSLHGLSLWRNLITGKGVEDLAIGLRENSTLQWLGLGCNSIGDQGVQALTEALVDNIANCKITWLALGNNKITDKGAEMLSEFLTAGWTSIDEDEGVEGVACPVTSLGLGGNEISNKGAHELAQALEVNDKLKSLGLSYNKIGDEGAISFAEMLRNNNTLENLSLSGNQISTKGGETLIASLCQNNSLSTLLLSQNPLDDSVCTRCTEVFTRYNVTLQVLDLSDTNITPSALHLFMAQLKETKSKIRLPLFGDQILTISEKDRTSKRISGNLLESASWRPPPSSMVPNRGLFDISERTRDLFDLPAIAVPQYKNDNSELSQSSSNSSLELDMPMFSGKVVEEEGNIAEPNDKKPSAVSCRSKVGWNRSSGWRRSKIVQESLEIEPGIQNFSTSSNEDDEFDIPKMTEVTLIDEELSEPESEMIAEPESEKIAVTETESQTNPVEEIKTRLISQITEDDDDTSNVTEKNQTTVEKRHEQESEKEANENNEVPEYSYVPASVPDDSVTYTYNIPRPVTEYTYNIPRPTTEYTYNIPRPTTEYTYNIPRPVHDTTAKELNEPLYDEIPKEYTNGENCIRLDANEGKVFYDPSQATNNTQHNATSEDTDGFQDINRQPILYSMTKERPKPPFNRRNPSLSPSHSISHLPLSENDQKEEGLLYVNIDYVEEASSSDDESKDSKVLSLTNSEIKDTRPIKEQWETGLKQRIAVLKMGGFIHKGYDAITTFTKTIEYNYFMAELACNEKKNKVGGPLAPSHTRVKLQRVMEDLGSDYINANFLGSPSYPKSYIITQWPTEITLPTFWRMIWELNVGVIVVLGNGEKEEKFWPKKNDYQLHPAIIMGEWSSDSIFVRTDKEAPTNIEGLTEASIVVHNYDDNITEKITLYHYPQWPQNGVPQSALHIAYMFHKSLAARLSATSNGPLVIVSAHGGGRSGCYCAVSVAYELMQVPNEPNPFDDDPNILGSVFKGLLSQRPGLVATQRQYDLCHRALEECLWGVAGHTEEETDSRGKSGKLFNMFKKKKKSMSS